MANDYTGIKGHLILVTVSGPQSAGKTRVIERFRQALHNADVIDVIINERQVSQNGNES